MRDLGGAEEKLLQLYTVQEQIALTVLVQTQQFLLHDNMPDAKGTKVRFLLLQLPTVRRRRFL